MKATMLVLALASFPLCACALDGTPPEKIDVAASEPVSLATSAQSIAAPSASAEMVATPIAAAIDAACTRKGALCAADEPRSDEELARCRIAAANPICGQAFRDLKSCEARDVKCDENGARLARFVCVEETTRWIDCETSPHDELPSKGGTPLIAAPL